MPIDKSITPSVTESENSILKEFDLSTALPANYTSELQMSDAIQKKCSEVGFDWPSEEPVFSKIHEELDEVKEAISNPNKGQIDIEEELGDLLFACVNLCRHLQVDPEHAIALANKKFTKRFQFIERSLHAQGKQLNQQTLETLETLWIKAKSNN